MAHDVKFSIPKRALGTADVEFDVHRDGSKLGTLKVSKGSLVWFPSGTSYGHKIGWKKFDELMTKHAMRPNNFEPIEWTYKYIGKQLYRILFKRTDLELNKIVL